MKTSVFLDDELAGQVKRASSQVGKDEATVLRLAIRAGLPLVATPVPATRPEGYFAADYEKMSAERVAFEEAMGQQPQVPER